MIHRFKAIAGRAAVLALVMLSPAASQEGTWSVVVSPGFGLLSMTKVNETLDRTVFDWNDLKNVPIGPFLHFNTTLFFSAQGAYRFERDVSVTLFVSAFSKKISNSYHDPAASLDLKRSVGSVDVMAGFQYYFQPISQELQAYAGLQAGMMFARARATTLYIKTVKTGPVDTTRVDLDTRGNYKKIELIVRLHTGLEFRFFNSFFFTAEVSYRLANIGKMDGTLQRLQGTFDEPSASDFNLSMLGVTAGLGFTF